MLCLHGVIFRSLSQAFKDRSDASFRKACKWKLTRKQYTFMDLLSEVDSKLFAKCKSEGHICYRQVIQVVMLWFCVLVVMTMMSVESLTRLQSGRS